MLLLVPEFIYTVDIGLHRGCHYVGVGTKAVVDVAIILNLHVHFTDIVRPLIYSLNCELLESHLLSDNLLECFYSRIDWTIARSSVLKLLSGNIEAYRCYAANALAGSDLEVIETDSVVGSSIGSCEHENVIIGNLLLFVGKDKKFLVNFVELVLILNLNAVDLEPVFQCCTAGTSCENNRIVVDSYILRIHNLIRLDILQNTILMYA